MESYKFAFGLCQELMLNLLFINKQPKDLCINRDTILPANREYIFDNIYIKNCTLKIHTRGILVLKSLNNIILENGNIDLRARNSYSLPWTSEYDNCIHSRGEYDKVSIGKQGSNGDNCSGGGIGGNGLKLECDKLILCKNSKVCLRGTDKLHNCTWYCGGGGNDTLLLLCNLIKFDDSSGIVVNSIDMKQYKYMKLCLVYGIMRENMLNNTVVNDVCNILDKYLMDDRNWVFDKYHHDRYVNFIDLETYRKKTDQEQKEAKHYQSFYTGVDNNSSVFLGVKCLCLLYV